MSFGDLDSATSTSGRMLFSRLGVTANQTNEPLPEALDSALGGQGRRGRRPRRGENRPRSATSAATVAFTSSPFRGRRLWSRSTLPLTSPPPTGPTLSARPMPVETVGRADGACRARCGRRDRRARTRSAGLRGSSLTIMTVSSATTATRIGATSISRPTPRGRPEPGPDLAAAQSWLDAKKSSADGSLEAFRASAKSAAASAELAKRGDSDRLYDGLTRWRGLMQ